MRKIILLLSAAFFTTLIFGGAYALITARSDGMDMTGNGGSLLPGGTPDGSNQRGSDEIPFMDQENDALILESVADEDLRAFVQSLRSGDEDIAGPFLTTEGLAIMAWEAGEERTRIGSQSFPLISTSTGVRRSFKERCWEPHVRSSRKLRPSWEELCPDWGSTGSGTGRGASGMNGKQAAGGDPRPGTRLFPDGQSGGTAGGGGGAHPGVPGVPVYENNEGSSGGSPYRPSDPSGSQPGWGAGDDWNELGNGEGAPPSEIVEIPAPSTLVLLVLGFLCLIATRQAARV